MMKMKLLLQYWTEELLSLLHWWILQQLSGQEMLEVVLMME